MYIKLSAPARLAFFVLRLRECATALCEFLLLPALVKEFPFQLYPGVDHLARYE